LRRRESKPRKISVGSNDRALHGTTAYSRHEFYTDFCLGGLRSFRIEGEAAADDRALRVTLTSPTSFGEDGARRVYVATLDGPVYRLDPASG